MDEDLKQYLDSMKHDIGTLRTDLMAHAEAVETRQLGEFFKWARTADAR